MSTPEIHILTKFDRNRIIFGKVVLRKSNRDGHTGPKSIYSTSREAEDNNLTKISENFGCLSENELVEVLHMLLGTNDYGPYLYSGLAKVHSPGQLLTNKGVGVVGPLKHSL